MAKVCQIQRWFVLKPMGTYRRPTQQYHRRRLGSPFPQNTRCGVSLPFSLRTFHIHVGLFKLLYHIAAYIFLILYEAVTKSYSRVFHPCYLVPRFPLPRFQSPRLFITADEIVSKHKILDLLLIVTMIYVGNI